MKKIITKILLIFFLLISVGLYFTENTFAEDMTVIVTEKIPWANCVEETLEENTDYPVKTWKYKCTIKPWFGSIMIMLWDIIKYFTYIAGLGWVLFIVINGMMYSMWGMDQGMKDESKKRISKTLIWLILLFLSWSILNMIAPWIYK